MSADQPPADEKNGPAPAPRARRPLWPALVAVAVVLAAVFAWKSHAIAAWWSGPAKSHAPRPPAPPVPAPAWAVDRANAIRQEAYTACKEGQWALCEDKLDAASYLDPQGDKSDAVRLARQTAYEGLHPDAADGADGAAGATPVARPSSPPLPSASAARSPGSSG